MIGIYCITNTINNKRYIGQSRNIKKRWCNHRNSLKKHCHDNYLIQEDYDKYGMNCFDFEVLEECPISMLEEREIYWISFFNAKNTGYNRTNGGGGLVEPTEDVRKKISNNLKGERNGMYGVCLCGEKNWNYGRHLSESTRKKISEAHKKMTGVNSITRRPVQASTGEIFYVMLDAIKWANLKDVSSIGKRCKGVTKTAGRHPVTNEPLKWKYRDDLK